MTGDLKSRLTSLNKALHHVRHKLDLLLADLGPMCGLENVRGKLARAQKTWMISAPP